MILREIFLNKANHFPAYQPAIDRQQCGAVFFFCVVTALFSKRMLQQDRCTRNRMYNCHFGIGLMMASTSPKRCRNRISNSVGAAKQRTLRITKDSDFLIFKYSEVIRKKRPKLIIILRLISLKFFTFFLFYRSTLYDTGLYRRFGKLYASFDCRLYSFIG